MKKKFKIKYLIISSFVIFALAALIHSLYDITNLRIFKPFAPINESVWEHLKMMFYAGIVFSLIECFLGYQKFKNYYVARGTSILISTTLIPIIYYGYTHFTGRGYLWVDITITFVISFISQLLFRKILLSNSSLKKYNPIIIILVIISILLFAYFTYYPPNLKIFIPH